MSDEKLMKTDKKTKAENYVKKGCLKIYHEKVKKLTKEHYFILYPQSEYATARLQQYRNAESADKNKYSPEFTVLPSDVEHVDPLPGEDSKFMVLCFKEKLILGAENDFERNIWMTALKEYLLNDSGSLPEKRFTFNGDYFQVQIHKETQECLGDHNSVYLTVNSDEISIITEAGTYLATWPHSTIRSRGIHTEQQYFFIKTGKLAQYGEGIFKFYSPQFQTINNCIKQRRKSAPAQSSSTSSRSVTPVEKKDQFLELANNKSSFQADNAYLTFDEIQSPAINTGEFIELLPSRPALWQKDNPDFANQEVHDALLREMADELQVTVIKVKDRLKTLKKSMKEQVNLLPKTKSGAPAFENSSQITWPYFNKLLFMKDEFVELKITSSHQEDAQCSGQDYGSHLQNGTNKTTVTIDNQNDGEDLLEQALEPSGMQSFENRHASRESPNSTSEDSQSKRKRYGKKRHDDIEQEKLKLMKESFSILMQKINDTKDPLEEFVLDLTNDLKEIENKRLLIQTKLELKQITLRALLKQIDSNVEEAPNIHRSYRTQSPTGQLQDPMDLSGCNST